MTDFLAIIKVGNIIKGEGGEEPKKQKIVQEWKKKDSREPLAKSCRQKVNLVLYEVIFI